MVSSRRSNRSLPLRVVAGPLGAWLSVGLLLLIVEWGLVGYGYPAVGEWAGSPWGLWRELARRAVPAILIAAVVGAAVASFGARARSPLAGTIARSAWPAILLAAGGWAVLRAAYPGGLRLEWATMAAAVVIPAGALVGAVATQWLMARQVWRALAPVSMLAGLAMVVTWGLALMTPVPETTIVASPLPAQGGPSGLAGNSVVLITVDTLRASHMSSYGYERATTPSIDAWASKAVLFENAIAVRSFTAPAMASIHTGLYPLSHGVLTHPGVLVGPRSTVAEAFSALGYETVAFVINPALRNRRFGFDQGFAEWYTYDNSTRAEEILADARARIDGQGAAPLFVWIHLLDPHTPYRPPAPWNERFTGDEVYGQVAETPMRRIPNWRRRLGAITRGRPAPYELNLVEVLGADIEELGLSEERLTSADFFVAQYDGEIAYLDSHLGPFLEELGQLLDDPVVVLTADHGESLVEHGYLFAHGQFAYQTTAHVPLIIRAPGSPPRRVTRRVSQVDILPTLAELSGFDAGVTEGLSLGSELGRANAAAAGALAGRVAVRTGARSSRGYPTLALLEANLKLIVVPRRLAAPLDALLSLQIPSAALPTPARRWYRPELYDLDADPLETTDLALRRPDEVVRLGRMLQQQVALSDVLATHEIAEVVLDEELRAQLRALGYIR